MKRFFSLLLTLGLLLALAACGLTGAPAREEKPAPAGETVPAGEPAPEETPVPAGEPAPEEKPVPAGESALPEGFAPDFRFSAAALDGTAVNESVFADHALTMINFFEPWCPPCIAELPDLEKLYETYAPQGFQILGVFSTEEGVEAVVSDAGLSYPVLYYVPAFDRFQTGYVPTTIFVNGEGRVVGETQIGSRSYGDWEALVKELLG